MREQFEKAKDEDKPGIKKQLDDLLMRERVWSAIAILPSTPFAMAELLPPELWQAISILLKANK